MVDSAGSYLEQAISGQDKAWHVMACERGKKIDLDVVG
jgi:hypothetical protein